MAQTTGIRLVAVDGEALAATLFAPEHGGERGLVAVVNSGAGIPASYYRRFAEGLAERGIVTITYDYRGIGQSRPHKLRGYKASIKDWAELDAPAVLGWAREHYPERSRAVIGHSIGGFLVGFAPDPTLVDYIVLVGAHTGYWRDYAAWARPLMWAMWHALMPAVTRTMGYFPARRFGLPEDLPAGVAKDWASRTRPDFDRNYLLPDGSLDRARLAQIRAGFGAIAATVLAITFSDDPFATPAATVRLRGLFRGCTFDERRINTRAHGLGKVGHFGFFRAAARQTLWPIVMDWLVAADPIGGNRSRESSSTIVGAR
jgi:predicted alpha/beta hydrolase